MIWTIVLNEPAHFVRATVQGDFALEDCRAMREDFLSRHYWQPGMNILIDFRQAFFVNLKLDVLRVAAASHKIFSDRIGNGRMAFLMKSPHDFGLARQYEMVTEGKVLSHIYVFLDENKSLEWVTSMTVIS